MTVQKKIVDLPKSQEIYPNFIKGKTIILHEGDTLEFLKSVPNNYINLVVTSPPYNIGKIYESKTDLQTYLSDQEEVIIELVRTLKVSGSICWEVGNFIENGEVFPLDVYFYDIFKNQGLKLRNRIVWHFGHGLHCKNRFSGRYEIILWFSKTDEYIFNLDPVRIPAKYPGKRAYKGSNKGNLSGNPKGKNPSDIWKILENEWEDAFWEFPNVKSNHPEKTVHPCQFPVELVERCVLALTNKEHYVLDPYCGVGTTLIAGLKHQRKVIGVDKEANYIEIAKNRINNFFEGKLRTRPLGKRVYQPTGREKVAKVPEEWINYGKNK
ncbi:MAG: site-specific DNA-methyltransferase [Candidatus Lokiarchaeota archaeon]|nr:site-specific DNA-methyltransferase [Candidatus Lokiarchaeota archaeon]